MTDTSDNALSDASALQRAAGGELSLTSNSHHDSDQDALRVLLQASAAAEALQGRFSELQQQRAHVDDEKRQLDADRSAFETRAREFAEQVARDRTMQREVNAEIEHRQQQSIQQQTDLDQQLEILEEGRQELDAKRQRLSEVVNEELARERGILQKQRDALDEERNRQTERAQEHEQQYTERLNKIEHDLQVERETMRQSVRKELAAELDEINRERAEWDDVKDRQALELKEQSEDLQQQRELFGEQLDAEQGRLRDEIEKRRQTLLSEQNNLQRRYRFQFEHLGRAREDFEEELRELRRSQQLYRTERMKFDEQHRLRFQQLQRVHELLSDRDVSLKREQKVVERERMSVDIDLKRQAERLQEHQDSVMQDLEARSRRLRQAEQQSAETAQRVEQRLQHVNQLRVELDSKQRDILEQRLLLEEIQAHPDSGGPSDKNSPQYVQAKTAVSQFFERLHQPLRSERDRLEEQATALEVRKEQFRKDRSELEQWFSEKEKELANKSSGVRTREDENVIELEEELARVRQRWNVERREAETTIRQLLDQLASAEKRKFTAPIVFADEGRSAA